MRACGGARLSSHGSLWEKRFASAAKRRAREKESSDKTRVWRSILFDVVQFGLPSVLSIGLAVDGLVFGGIIFYAPGWSLFPPFSEVFQVVGSVLLFLGLPLFTAGAYLTGKYVYSKLPDERLLLQRGPYRYIRHPIYLSFLLTAAGFLLLAQSLVMLPLLFGLSAVSYPKREEEELVRLYGDAYVEYRSHTGRFLPKFHRR